MSLFFFYIERFYNICNEKICILFIMQRYKNALELKSETWISQVQTIHSADAHTRGMKGRHFHSMTAFAFNAVL